MWLINTRTIQLQQFANPEGRHYAILSHTWEKGELTFQDLVNDHHDQSNLNGWEKIEKTCGLARGIGLDYAWIDTCCIDKTSSAELSEAINSMFSWYRSSAVCFAYLSTLRDKQSSNPVLDDLASYKWFERGWTLQELVASPKIVFFGGDWQFLGTKEGLCDRLAKITGIDAAVLRNLEDLPTIPVARRLSWAAMRKTTRPEDIAYCLLGIFNINMPLLYGEGPKAFLRLQEEIARSTNDLSLFAWKQVPSSREQNMLFRGIFARSPDEFQHCDKIFMPYERLQLQAEFTITNRGLRLHGYFAVPGLEDLPPADSPDLILGLDCFERSERTKDQVKWVAVRLRKIGAKYVRMLPEQDHHTGSRIWRLNADTQKVVYIAISLSDSETNILHTDNTVGIFYHQSLYDIIADTSLDHLPSQRISYDRLYDADRFGSHGLHSCIHLHTFKIRLRRSTPHHFALVCGLHAQRERELQRGLRPWALVCHEEDFPHSLNDHISKLGVFAPDAESLKQLSSEDWTEAFRDYVFERYSDKSGRLSPELMQDGVTIEETLDGSKHRILVRLDPTPQHNWERLSLDYSYFIRLSYERLDTKG